jgi:mono/diheme cytochrome c family protein
MRQRQCEVREMTRHAVAVGSIAILAAMAALPAGGQGSYHNPVRHHYASDHGIPAAYANARNPLRPTAGNLKAGEALYAQNCESCHGATGMGDGPAGKNLDPPPPALAGGHMPMIDDGYRMWAVSEGGAALKTGMPAFKDTLTMNQRWLVLLYLERGLPTPRRGRGPHMHGGPMGRGMHGRGMGPGMGGPPDDE